MKNRKYMIAGFILLVLIIMIAIFFNNRRNSNLPEMGIIEDPKEVIPAYYVETLENGNLENVSEKLKEIKEIDDLKISNIQIMSRNQMTVMNINLKNTSNQERGDKNVTFVMKDEKGNEIGKIDLYIKKIEAGQSIGVEINTDFSLINTYDFSILE